MIPIEEVLYSELIRDLRMMQRNIPSSAAHWELVSFGQFGLPASVGLLRVLRDASPWQFADVLVWLMGQSVRPYAQSCYAGALLTPNFSNDVRHMMLMEHLLPDDE
ncbi:hypothetical protein GV829_10105 [Sphingomonas lacunae]|uniref:Uncharacterized protein n=1 Tax=Sphingomonas lacunae TaxID=2698828 RepID=A0A6M4AWL2_9SPHN|nr:hypothetical protein [Sphingomonas lacunae]QJQ32750.1 hypothetical protein GV829_10105 [Sphingomonas lacunae]